MNKWLVVSNIVLAILLLSAVLVGCSGADTRVDWAIAQIQALQQSVADLQSLKSTIDQNSLQIQNNAVQIANTQANLQSGFDQIQQYLNALAK